MKIRYLGHLLIIVSLLVSLSSCGGGPTNHPTETIWLHGPDASGEPETITSVNESELPDPAEVVAPKVEGRIPPLRDFLYTLDNHLEIKDVYTVGQLLISNGFKKINSNKYVLESGGSSLLTVTLDYGDWGPEYEDDGEMLSQGGFEYEITFKFRDRKDADSYYRQYNSISSMPDFILLNQSGNTVKLSTFAD